MFLNRATLNAKKYEDITLGTVTDRLAETTTQSHQWGSAFAERSCSETSYGSLLSIQKSTFHHKWQPHESFWLEGLGLAGQVMQRNTVSHSKESSGFSHPSSLTHAQVRGLPRVQSLGSCSVLEAFQAKGFYLFTIDPCLPTHPEGSLKTCRHCFESWNLLSQRLIWRKIDVLLVWLCDIEKGNHIFHI